MEQEIDKAVYYELIDIVKEYGLYSNKRHGYYVKLPYVADTYFILDTWNNSLSLVGEGIDICLGIDFGGFNLKVNTEIIMFYIKNIYYELGLIELCELYDLDLG